MNVEREQKKQIKTWEMELSKLQQFVTKGLEIGDDPNAPTYRHANIRIFQLEQALAEGF